MREDDKYGQGISSQLIVQSHAEDLLSGYCWTCDLSDLRSVPFPFPEPGIFGIEGIPGIEGMQPQQPQPPQGQPQQPERNRLASVG